MNKTQNAYSGVLKKLRKDKGLTVERLSNLSDISKRTIERAESGTHEPHMYTLNKILPILDTTVEEYYDLLWGRYEIV